MKLEDAFFCFPPIPPSIVQRHVAAVCQCRHHVFFVKKPSHRTVKTAFSMLGLHAIVEIFVYLHPFQAFFLLMCRESQFRETMEKYKISHYKTYGNTQ